MRRVVAVTLCAVAVLGTTTTARGAAVQYRPGAPSRNDPYVPGVGNGGYDVQHYGIVLSYDPASGVLAGTTTVTATTTQNLSQFNLDFALPASDVTVNGAPATFVSRNWPTQNTDRELIVTPERGIPRGAGLTVVVRYTAKPAQTTIHGFTEWNPTLLGAVSVWDEPFPASEWWYPANAYPSDKATYDVTVTMPKAYTAISNGRLLSRTISGADATAHWRTSEPMASYLSVLTLGRFDVVRTRVLNGIPAYFAVEQGLGPIGQRAMRDLQQTPSVLSFLQSQWGAYPFDAAGGTVVSSAYSSALETQTKPTYLSGFWKNDTSAVWAILHENSHQWFGDDVTTRTWSDCWVAEGFATYNEWLWSQAQHEGTAEQLFLTTYRLYPPDSGIWLHPLNRPDFSPLSIEVYDRGAMMLQALRNRVGAATFAAIVRSWLNVHRYGNGDSGDFVALAQSMTRVELTSFFQAWLYGTGKPAPTVVNGFPAADQRALNTGAMPVPPSLTAIQRTDAALAGR